MTTNTKTTAYTFAPDSMTCKGKTFQVEYAIQPSGTVTAFVQLDDRRVRVRFDEGAAEYPAARAAAEAARAAWTAARTAAPATADKQEDKPAEVKSAAAKKPRTKKERPEIIPVDKPAAPAQEERPETIPADKPAERPETIPTPEVLPVTPAADPKAARAAAPEKTFAGTEITGNGWKILFDADQQRTRIIFADAPTDAAKKVLDAAGFFYSGRMQSWNKKLTFRAYRAAQFVAQELTAIYSA